MVKQLHMPQVCKVFVSKKQISKDDMVVGNSDV